MRPNAVMQVWEFVQNLASVHMEEEPAVLQSSSSCLGDNDTSALQGSDGPDVSMLAVPSVPAAEAVENVPMDAHRGACPGLGPRQPAGFFSQPAGMGATFRALNCAGRFGV